MCDIKRAIHLSEMLIPFQFSYFKDESHQLLSHLNGEKAHRPSPCAEDPPLATCRFQRPPPPPHIACQEFLMDFETDTEYFS